MAKVTGRIELIFNGKVLLNKAGAKASGIGRSGEPSFERKEVTGDTGVHGFKEEPVIPQCEVTITDTDEVNLDEIVRITSGTLIFRTAGGGKSYTLTDCWCTGNLSVTGGEGEVPLVFKGAYWTEAIQ